MNKKIYNKKKFNMGIILLILAIVICFSVTVIKSATDNHIVPETTSNVFANLDETNQINAVTVLRVVDGDTLFVKRNGNEEKIRLIGIDTPESVNPDESKNTEEGVIASDFTKRIIKEGQTVYLEFDECVTDKYGRTLAYVWLTSEIPTLPTLEDISENMLNGILLSKGYASTMKIEPNTKYSYRFGLIEMKAKSNSVGFWNDAT